MMAGQGDVMAPQLPQMPFLPRSCCVDQRGPAHPPRWVTLGDVCSRTP